MLYLIATIGSPLALGTVLLFYFGWVRTKTQAEKLGYDLSILDLSTTDYMLKSISALTVPLVPLLVLALALNGVHQRLIVPLSRRARHRAFLLYLAKLLRMSWILWSIVGFGLLLLASPNIRGFALPVSITMAVLCAAYGRTLRKRLTDTDPWSATGKVLAIALLTFAVFWDVERIARSIGEGYGALIAANPQRLTAVTVYSTKSLWIEMPGVAETRRNNPDTEYSYRYEGLRLLEQSGDRYFLISERWDEQHGRVLVLRETNRIRLEFASRV